MTADERDLVESLFAEVLELPEEQREEFLAGAHEDPALIEEVRSLLRYVSEDSGRTIQNRIGKLASAVVHTRQRRPM